MERQTYQDGFNDGRKAVNRILADERESLRAKVVELKDVLRMAQGHIVKHHNASKQVVLGEFCPVCVHDDGTEPELDAIAKALQEKE